jgi:hypothetical protein
MATCTTAPGAHRERQQPPVLGYGPFQELDLDLELPLRLGQLLVLALAARDLLLQSLDGSLLRDGRSREPRQDAKPGLRGPPSG